MVRRVRALTIALVLVSLTRASAFAEMGFYLPEQLPAGHVPEGLAAAYAASVYLKGRNFWTPDCNGTVLSPDGYVITALHCVEGCGSVAFGKYQVFEAPTPYEYWEAFTRTPQGVTCLRDVFALGLADPKLVFIGRGEVTFDETHISGVPADGLAKMAELSSDYAILKFETDRSLPCIPAAEEPLQAGDEVWGIGQPYAVTRPNGFSSDGSRKYVRFGGATDDLSLNSSFQKHGVPPGEIAGANEFFTGVGNFFADLDVIPGDSGSTLINARGELVGVLTLGHYVDPDDPVREYMRYIAGFETIGKVREDVRRTLGEEAAARIFSCR
jgi:hypothetical protein